MQAATQKSIRHNAVDEILIARFICINYNKSFSWTVEDLKTLFKIHGFVCGGNTFMKSKNYENKILRNLNFWILSHRN